MSSNKTSEIRGGSAKSILSFITVICSVVGLALFTSRDPECQGYKLSDWLQIGYGAGMTHGETDREDADQAVRQIGAKAIPYLVRELGVKYSELHWNLYQLARKQSFIQVSFRYPDERRSRAIGGFQALGKTAAPALPKLRNYLNDPELRDDAQMVIDAIAGK